MKKEFKAGHICRILTKKESPTGRYKYGDLCVVLGIDEKHRPWDIKVLHQKSGKVQYWTGCSLERIDASI